MNFLDVPPDDVNKLHTRSDVDTSDVSQHHTLGMEANQASPGRHTHDGKNSLLLPGYVSKEEHVSVTGSRGGNVALQNLLNTLSGLGIIDNNTTA